MLLLCLRASSLALGFKSLECMSKGTIQKRYDWVSIWKDLDLDFSKNYAFTDEAGFDINMWSSRAWAPKGPMAIVTTPTTKAPSPTVIRSKDATADHYVRLLEATLDKHDQIRESYLIMDNAPIHSSKQMAELIESRSRTQPVYLPPHSPELNLIEQSWALMKGKAKRHELQHTETFEQSIVDTVKFPLSTSPKHNPTLKKSV
ncbi:hypothetical protein G6F46_005538 [Rhizopus delemar]|uniref:Tc1-like transposase DDE domain-containing protein n=2 Tax=Rhizopus TaxID=4842 RepID=A0A9P7CSK1_9FUNG|nr:hypothetical protein G6F55_002758 [Rhizopus delemar]KAG1543043.1 hypothetical protein G6F51_006908 [Rhizopus arrhizus]KAG1500983.1 hypothetical protein G6F54_003349 [Rhizopus delemar]KAG1514638.1 hypothetical protein G6F53_003524 [Rhizopus delemar]KAG1522366.1 hypothetical protein G6F52_005923 [Rhizopus delemar]